MKNTAKDIRIIAFQFKVRSKVEIFVHGKNHLARINFTHIAFKLVSLFWISIRDW